MIDWDLAEKLWNQPKETEMVKRSYNIEDKEPDVKTFDKPSEKEHLFQVVEVFTSQDNPFSKGLPDDVVAVKMEVCGGDEQGRTILQRLNIDDTFKGFFATKLFLKAIGEEYKGSFELDTDRWIGRQCFATIKHNGDYANIASYNFKKVIEQYKAPVGQPTSPDEIAWES